MKRITLTSTKVAAILAPWPVLSAWLCAELDSYYRLVYSNPLWFGWFVSIVICFVVIAVKVGREKREFEFHQKTKQI